MKHPIILIIAINLAAIALSSCLEKPEQTGTVRRSRLGHF